MKHKGEEENPFSDISNYIHYDRGIHMHITCTYSMARRKSAREKKGNYKRERERGRERERVG